VESNAKKSVKGKAATGTESVVIGMVDIEKFASMPFDTEGIEVAKSEALGKAVLSTQ